MEEQWKDISGFEGHYQVSNLGRVRSLDTIVTYKTRIGSYLKNGVIKKHIINRKGYCAVQLKVRGKIKQRTTTIHRLVAEAFLENLDNKKQVNHIDGDKTNNNVNNLEWCTNYENKKHAVDNSLVHTLLNKVDVLKIKYLLKKGDTQLSISKLFNVSHSCIKSIAQGRTWKHLD